MLTLAQITQSIMQDPDNQSFTAKGIEPLFAAPTSARINIVGQAPGIKAQESRLYWNDKSGDRLLSGNMHKNIIYQKTSLM